MKRLLVQVALATGLISHAYGQTYPGQLPSNSVLGNSTGSPLPFPTVGPLLNSQMNNMSSGTMKCKPVFASSGAPQDCNYATVNVVDEGAKCDGSTDDTTAFQSALAAISSAGGGTLYIPPSTSGCVAGSSPLTYSGTNLRVTGGGLASLVKKTTLTGDLFTVSSQNWIQFDNFSISAPTTSSAGVLIDFTNLANNAGNFWITHMQLTGGFDQVVFAGGQTTFISDCNMQFFKDDAIHYGTAYQGSAYVTNTNINTTTNTGFGIIVENGDGILFQNINNFGAATPFYFHPQAATGFVRNVWGSNIFGDTSSTGNGWTFDGSNAGAFLERINLTNVWAGGNVGDGFAINTVKEFSCVNCRAIGNQGQGFHLSNTNVGIRLIGGTAEGNSSASSGTNDGIRVDNGTSHLFISNMRSGPSSSEFVTNSQKYGLDFTGGVCNQCLIENNDVSGNVTAGINTAITGTSSRVEGNTGYNPVGTSASASTGVSGSTITAGPSPETHWISQSASFNAVVVKNGVGTCQVASAGILCVMQLGPNESYDVTWTTTQPTYIKDVH